MENALILQLMTEIDQINAKILQALESNGRISNTDLADRVGLSPSACLRRVQELERQNVITGYRAVINPAARGVGITAIVSVGLSEHRKEDQAAFEKAITKSAAVRECHNVTGAFEYFLRIEVENLEAYKNFHNDVLGTAPKVNSIETHIVMASPKDDRV